VCCYAAAVALLIDAALSLLLSHWQYSLAVAAAAAAATAAAQLLVWLVADHALLLPLFCSAKRCSSHTCVDEHTNLGRHCKGLDVLGMLLVVIGALLSLQAMLLLLLLLLPLLLLL
jgi:hypothetical protein